MAPKIIFGTTLLRVGERSPRDRRYASDEFVLAAPGTIVAPRPRNEPPTMETAVRQLVKTLQQAKPVRAQAGAVTDPSLLQGTALLQQFLSGLLPGMGMLMGPEQQFGLAQIMGYLFPGLMGMTNPVEFAQAYQRAHPAQLFQEVGKAPIYFLEPTTGQLRHITDPAVMEAMGAPWGGVRTVSSLPGPWGAPITLEQAPRFRSYFQTPTLGAQTLALQAGQQRLERVRRGLQSVSLPGAGTFPAVTAPF